MSWRRVRRDTRLYPEPAAGSTARPAAGRFLLVWLTSLPSTDDGRFRGEVAELVVKATEQG